MGAHRTCQVPLTGTYQRLSTLVATDLTAAGKALWPNCGSSLYLRSNRLNVAATRVQIVASGADTPEPEVELLPEAVKEYLDAGGRNGISMQDKLVRIVDNAGAATTGVLNVGLTTT